ncbi:MAG: hypothetical protein U1F41_04050 [Burkholderiales bacterium]
MNAEVDPPAPDRAALRRASGESRREGNDAAPPASVPWTAREDADRATAAPFGRRWFLAVAFRSAG